MPGGGGEEGFNRGRAESRDMVRPGFEGTGRVGR